MGMGKAIEIMSGPEAQAIFADATDEQQTTIIHNQTKTKQFGNKYVRIIDNTHKTTRNKHNQPNNTTIYPKP